MKESKKEVWYNKVSSKVKEQLDRNASAYFKDDNKIAFLIPDVVSMKSIGWCRFRYWQILPYDSAKLLLIVYKKF